MQANNENQQTVVIGGNLNDAVNGQYTLSLTDAFKQTFEQTKKHWVPIFLGFLAFMGILIIVSFITVSLLPDAWLEQLSKADEPMSKQALLALSVFGAAVGAPFWGGLLLMGIRHSVDIPTKAADIFNGFSKAGPLILTLVITSLITQSSIMLLTELHWVAGILAQVYLTTVFAFSLPLVIERGITPLNAIFYSIRIINYKLPTFVILMLIITGLIILSLLMFGIPLIYIVPLIFNLVGVVYKDVIGVTVNLDQKTPKDDDNKPWTA